MGCGDIIFPSRVLPLRSSVDSLDTFHRLCDINTGPRHNRFFSDTTSTSFSIDYDYYEPVSLSVLFLAPKTYIDADLSDIELYFSDDDITYTLYSTLSAPMPDYGSKGQDILWEFGPSPSHQYWRVNFVYTASIETSFAKLYLTNPTSLGVYPSIESRETRDNDVTPEFKTTGGQRLTGRTIPLPYEYSLVYEGVTNENAYTFMQQVARRGGKYVILLQDANEDFFNAYGAMHGEISRVEIERTALNANTISFTFTEMIG